MNIKTQGQWHTSLSPFGHYINVANSGLAEVQPSHVPALHMIGAVMAPVLHTLLQQKSVLVQERDELRQQVGQMQSSFQ